MDTNRLIDNIIDVVKEQQIKLGYRKESIRLYYPLGSLNTLLATNYDSARMQKHLEKTFANYETQLGTVEVSNRDDRFGINLPEKTSEYVHENTSDSGFLYDFIDLFRQHGVVVEEVRELFCKYSDDVCFECLENSEFDYVLYFENGEPDSYVYCITDEGHHLIYHRFTPEDYKDLFE